MSTGYMSGEAYELPEAREPLMEPTLASVEEISGSLRSEDLFTLTHSQVRKNSQVPFFFSKTFVSKGRENCKTRIDLKIQIFSSKTVKRVECCTDQIYFELVNTFLYFTRCHAISCGATVWP